MSKRCEYEHPNGKRCRRWPSEGSPFCYHHTPDPTRFKREKREDLHPLARLTTPDDVFDVVRETLNAARLGRIKPNQVYAVGYMVQQWIRLYYMQDSFYRQTSLYRQLNPDLVDEDEVADEARPAMKELVTLPNSPAEGKPSSQAGPAAAKPSTKKTA